MDFAAIAELCAPKVGIGTLKSIASVESSFNPYAIGVVGGRLQRQPKNRDEAIATAQMLKANGWNYSSGVIQVNQKNFGKYGLTDETAFDPCSNLRAGSQILQDCFKRAGGRVDPLGDALSCYYSGNFSTGYRAGYVAKVKAAGGSISATPPGQAIPVLATGALRRKLTVSARTAAPKADTIFVSAAASPTQIVAVEGDASPASKGPGTALLF